VQHRRRRTQSHCRRNVDDRAHFAGVHRGQQRSVEPDGGQEVDVEIFDPPGVVDDDVDVAEYLLGSSGQLDDTVGGGDVGLPRAGATTCLLPPCAASPPESTGATAEADKALCTDIAPLVKEGSARKNAFAGLGPYEAREMSPRPDRAVVDLVGSDLNSRILC
jgi:hypothetical protein